MKSSTGLRFLRPYLCENLVVSRKTAYLRFFNSTQCMANLPPKAKTAEWGQVAEEHNRPLSRILTYKSHDVKERVEELASSTALDYPRIKYTHPGMTCRDFCHQYLTTQPQVLFDGSVGQTLHGMNQQIFYLLTFFYNDEQHWSVLLSGLKNRIMAITNAFVHL
jgi:hypothetical protein